jgi:hypothetical protein
MARWHLTSSKDLHRRACELSEQAGMVAGGDWAGSGAFLRTYRKRVVAGANFEAFGEDDWTAVAGTLIFDRAIGGATLRAIHEAVMGEGDAARSRFLGHYAVAVKAGRRVHVFTDEQGSLSLYYGVRGGDFVISNSLQLVATLLGPGEADALAVLNYVLHLESVGPETFFPEVRRLFGGQRLVIDLPDRSLSVVRAPLAMETLGPAAQESADEAVSEYVGRVRDVFDQLVAMPSIGLNTTGGLDTRTVLAALLDRGIRPLLMTGVGNSHLTNSRAADFETAQLLASALELPFHRMDWSGRQPYSRDELARLFWRYGFGYTTYGASDAFLREYEGAIQPYPTLQLGGYSPAFTNMKPWEQASGAYTFDDIVGHYLLRPDPKVLKPEVFASYRQHVMAAARAGLAAGPLEVPDNGASAATFVQARLYLYIRPESMAANFYNEFAYYLAPFLTKKLYDPLLTVPLEFRRGDNFQLRVINALCAACLQVPVFSGLRAQVLDLESFTMVRVQPPRPGRAPSQPRRGEPARRLARRLLPAQLRRRLRALVTRPVASPAVTAAPPAAARASAARVAWPLDDEIRRDSSRAVLDHPMGSLFGELAALDLVRLHRLHLVLVGIDEVARAARRDEAGT